MMNYRNTDCYCVHGIIRGRCLACELEQPDKLNLRAVRVMVRAFQELNTIRARDGVPYTHNGSRSSVEMGYFSSIVDELDEVVTEMTGKSAHCHPELYI